MRPEEELIKKRDRAKRKKSRSRRIRVVLTLVIIITLVSLVFYMLDNPGFPGNIRNKIMSLFSSGTETTVETGLESNNTGDESPAFWQRITEFFKQRMAVDEEKFPTKLDINFYFASLGEEEKFVYEKRTINAGDPKFAVENVMKELLNGPVKPFHYPVIPPGTKLLDVEIYENLAKIDLSQEFLENSLESGILDEYVIYTIVNTVTQVPEIDGLIFLIDGKRIKIYGNVDLSIPAIKNEKYLGEE